MSKRLPVLIAALILLALSVSCGQDATPTPASDMDAVIATAVARALATARAEGAIDSTSTNRSGAASLTGDGPGATATAAAIINAEAAALSEALRLALDYYYNSSVRGDRAAAISYAVSATSANPDAVARAMDEALGGLPTPVPALTDAAIATANAESEANALAAARAQADAAEAARQATAEAAARHTSVTVTPISAPGYVPPPPLDYESWNDHEWLTSPKPWWRASNPYNCDPPSNPNSPWTAAGMTDLGGQDSLSLIRYFANGSYIRYGLMGFEGCSFMSKYPGRTHLDIPVDPAYYSLGSLEIAVDIARVPANAADWSSDNGIRIDMSMAEAVDTLNDNVAAYFHKISEGKLRMRFVAGHDFQASGRATPQEVEDQWLELIGITGCDPNDPNRIGCKGGMPGALNRLFLNDVGVFSGGSAWNGRAEMGLVSVKYATMTTLIHEIGHGWMLWPHSYTELPWKPVINGPYKRPNPYSNHHDFMSELTFARPSGWHQDLPATLAVNRYAAGWIDADEVALHLSDQGTYTLAKPRQNGNQFLVIHSGRPGAFTTLEVLDERNAVYRDTHAAVYDPASPEQQRPLRYDGVMVSRYDQTAGTGINARVGPALYNVDNPNYESDVGFGRDDYSVIADGESRRIGGGVTVSVTKNANGSYDVTVSGGKIAEYEPWCRSIWFSGEYDTGCALANFDFS